MKRNTLSYASCIATVSNNTPSLHSATIVTHTTACSHIIIENIVIPEMTSEANSSYSLLFIGREHGKGQYFFFFFNLHHFQLQATDATTTIYYFQYNTYSTYLQCAILTLLTILCSTYNATLSVLSYNIRYLRY